MFDVLCKLFCVWCVVFSFQGLGDMVVCDCVYYDLCYCIMMGWFVFGIILLEIEFVGLLFLLCIFVCEVVIKLEEEGLVDVCLCYGVMVKLLFLQDFNYILNVFFVLEVWVFELVVVCGLLVDEVCVLDCLLDEIEVVMLVYDFVCWVDLDDEFYFQIVVLCDNVWLQDVLSVIWGQ